MEKKPLIIELLVDEQEDTGVDIISFVENPAIEIDFMYFNDKSKDYKFKTTSTEKRLVTGPAMLPDEKIIRQDAVGEPYFVFFSKETVEKAQELYFKNANQSTANFEHEESIAGVTVVESWIVVDPSNDKSNALGFSDLPEGTWMVTYKVDDDEIWERIKAGEVLGFSVEGAFEQQIAKMKKVEIIIPTEDEMMQEIEDLLKSDKTETEIYDILKEKLK